MGGGGKGGSSSVVVGYWYALTVHFVPCLRLDRLRAVRVGDKVAWSGAQGDGDVSIDKPSLFGGEKKEGGLQGTLSVLRGLVTQGQHSLLKSLLGDYVPAFRGVCSMVWDGWLSALNPYPKAWEFLCENVADTWYSEKAYITDSQGLRHANPAHALRRWIIDTEIGLGWATSSIDDTAFRAAADTLYAEGMGMSGSFSVQGDVQDYIVATENYVDARVFTDPATGLWTIRLMRADYDPDELDTFGPDDIIEVTEFSRKLWGQVTNQITLKYKHRHATDGNVDDSITRADPASVALQGRIIPETVEFPYCPTPQIADKLCWRELGKRGYPLASLRIKANRNLADKLPGDVIRLTLPEYGLENVVMRVVTQHWGTPTDSALTMTLAEDVFGLNYLVATTPATSEWTSPSSDPAPSPYRKLVEVPYYTLVRQITGQNEAVLAGYDQQSGCMAVFASKPTSDAMGYELRVNTADGYVTRGSGIHTPTAALSGAVSATDTTLALTGQVDTGEVQAGALAWLGDECVMLKTPIESGSVTVARGVLDTVPVPHASGTRLWIPGVDDCGLDGTEVPEGATVTAKCLTRTSRGTLAEASAPADTVTFDARAFRPLPPGNVRLNGAYFPASITGALTVTWAHRDRIQQTTPTIVEQSAGNIGPEAGQTYTIRAYDETGALRRTVTGLTGTTWTWDTEEADSGLTGRLNTSLRVEVESVREGYESFTMWSVSTARA